jgi:hypothetical protein
LKYGKRSRAFVRLMMVYCFGDKLTLGLFVLYLESKWKGRAIDPRGG